MGVAVGVGVAVAVAVAGEDLVASLSEVVEEPLGSALVSLTRIKAQRRKSVERESTNVTTQMLITAVDYQSNQINGSVADPSK